MLETTAADVASVGKVWTPWYAKPFIRLQIEDALLSYDNVTALKEFAGPILVIGASEDQQLPVVLSQDLAQRLQGEGLNVSYVELEGAEHMNVAQHSDYTATILSFMALLEN